MVIKDMWELGSRAVSMIIKISGNMILSTRAWTQKADFVRAERRGAVSFSVGDKG
jgi:hypothetical protein